MQGSDRVQCAGQNFFFLWQPSRNAAQQRRFGPKIFQTTAALIIFWNLAIARGNQIATGFIALELPIQQIARLQLRKEDKLASVTRLWAWRLVGVFFLLPPWLHV